MEVVDRVQVLDAHAPRAHAGFASTVARTWTVSGSEYGSGLNRTASATLKMAVLAPMASASVRTATDVNIGALRSRRNASLRS